MRRLFFYTCLLALALSVSLFLVGNSQPVTLTYLPFVASASLTLPLWGILLVAMAIGVLLGALGMWMSDGSLRKKARDRKREIRRLESELTMAAEDTSSTPRLSKTKR